VRKTEIRFQARDDESSLAVEHQDRRQEPEMNGTRRQGMDKEWWYEPTYRSI